MRARQWSLGEAFKWTENFLARFRKFIGLIEYSPGFSFSRLGAWKEAPPAHDPLPSFGLHDAPLAARSLR